MEQILFTLSPSSLTIIYFIDYFWDFLGFVFKSPLFLNSQFSSNQESLGYYKKELAYLIILRQNYLKLSLSNLTTSHKFSNTRTHTFSKPFSWIVAPKSLIPSKKDNTSKLSFKHNSIHQHAKSSFIRYWGDEVMQKHAMHCKEGDT